MDKKQYWCLVALVNAVDKDMLTINDVVVRKYDTKPPDEMVDLVGYARWAETNKLGVYDVVIAWYDNEAVALEALREMKE